MIKDITPLWGQRTKLIRNDNGTNFVITEKKIGSSFVIEVYNSNIHGVIDNINSGVVIAEKTLEEVIGQYHKVSRKKAVSIKENKEKELLLD